MSPIFKFDAIINLSLLQGNSVPSFSIFVWKQCLIFSIPYAVRFRIKNYGNPAWFSEQRNLRIFPNWVQKKKFLKGALSESRSCKGEAEIRAARQNISGQATVQNRLF